MKSSPYADRIYSPEKLTFIESEREEMDESFQSELWVLEEDSPFEMVNMSETNCGVEMLRHTHGTHWTHPERRRSHSQQFYLKSCFFITF